VRSGRERLAPLLRHGPHAIATATCAYPG